MMGGRLVMIAGATSSIEKATAIGLAIMGDSMVLVGRSDEKLASVFGT
jgi:NADP-dependent 3-hydroxy acid dehydrogenase YdfG